MRRAIFPGSFDPFTIGHYDIVLRGLDIFDEIVIGIGKNTNKHQLFSIHERIASIQRLFANEPRIQVELYDCLTIDFAKQHDAQFILRGVRNIIDFEYERNLADINYQLASIETVLLYSRPQYAHISSSFVRELHTYHKDIKPYLP